MTMGAGPVPAGWEAGVEAAASAVIAMKRPNMPDMAGPPAVGLAKKLGVADPNMPDVGARVHQMPGPASVPMFR